MAAPRFNSTRSRNVTLALATLAVLHFLLSSFFWSLLVYAAVRQRWELRPVLLGALPAFLLLAWFAGTAVAAVRRLRIAAWLLAVGFAAGAAVFSYDAVTHNYQLHAEGYDSTGPGQTFYYATWWWYGE
jgi:hypothetical protein